MAQVTVTDRRGAERFAHFDLQQGDLLIGDAGYGYRTNLAYAHAKRADVLVRIHPSTFPLQDHDGRRFDVLAWLTRSQGSLAEWSGWCCFRGQLIAVRLIASKLPPDKVAAAQQRKKRKAQKAGRRISAATLVLAGWWLLITTLKASEWPPTEIVRLYRARWQIELVFKRLKQLLRVASIRAKDVQAVEATIRAILLAWALQEQVAAELRRLLPRNTDRTERPLSSWLLALLSVQTLRQQVRGQWSLERVRECLPQLLRLLVPSRRKRRQQEADIREWLEQRLRAALPLQEAA
jgi:hypothetical protein